MDRQNEHKLTGQPDFGRVMPDKPFLTIGEVADILQVSRPQPYRVQPDIQRHAPGLQDYIPHYANHQGGFLPDD